MLYTFVVSAFRRNPTLAAMQCQQTLESSDAGRAEAVQWEEQAQGCSRPKGGAGLQACIGLLSCDGLQPLRYLRG